MDKIKKRMIRATIAAHVAASINSYDITNEIESIVDLKLLDESRVNQELHEWMREKYNPNTQYVIDQNKNFFSITLIEGGIK